MRRRRTIAPLNYTKAEPRAAVDSQDIGLLCRGEKICLLLNENKQKDEKQRDDVSDSEIQNRENFGKVSSKTFEPSFLKRSEDGPSGKLQANNGEMSLYSIDVLTSSGNHHSEEFDNIESVNSHSKDVVDITQFETSHLETSEDGLSGKLQAKNFESLYSRDVLTLSGNHQSEEFDQIDSVNSHSKDVDNIHSEILDYEGIITEAIGNGLLFENNQNLCNTINLEQNEDMCLEQPPSTSSNHFEEDNNQRKLVAYSSSSSESDTEFTPSDCEKSSSARSSDAESSSGRESAPSVSEINYERGKRKKKKLSNKVQRKIKKSLGHEYRLQG